MKQLTIQGSLTDLFRNPNIQEGDYLRCLRGNRRFTDTLKYVVRFDESQAQLYVRDDLNKRQKYSSIEFIANIPPDRKLLDFKGVPKSEETPVKQFEGSLTELLESQFVEVGDSLLCVSTGGLGWYTKGQKYTVVNWGDKGKAIHVRSGAMRTSDEEAVFITQTQCAIPQEPDWYPPPARALKAPDLLQAALDALLDRAASRDVEDERSMLACVKAFNAMYTKDLTEEEGWMFMVFLKASRAKGGEPRADDYVDGGAFFTLAGESALKDR